ncbi:MAG: serine/threonine-protein kinase [Nocardiopsaceae bacterium]|nr:serine/threonine-protein kinase [Nocardiopsaceae bacterium]
MTSPPFSALRPRDPKAVGGYQIVGRLGAGGMGAVYAATDPSGALVAVKLVHGDLAADPDFRARFRREADLVRRVCSPCVPRFLASDTRAEQPWLATEYVAGPTLRAHVRDHGPLTGPALRAFAIGVAEALRAIHGAGIVHRDLKPGNVVLAADSPKVLDFGIARAMAETAITRTGGLFGTPGWVAPELLRGAAPGPPSDVFAWGGLVAYAATGRSPFGTGAAEAVAVRVLEGHPDLEGVPDDLMPLVRAATGQDPTRRPTVEQALAELLGDAGEATVALPGPEATELVTRVLRQGWEAPPEATLAPTVRPATPKRGPRGRRTGLMVGAAATTLALVAGAGWVLGDRFDGETVAPGEEAGDEAAPTGSGDGGQAGDAFGGELAVEVSGNGLFTVHAAPAGVFGVNSDFAGASVALPDGVERADHAVAAIRLTTVTADTASGTGTLVSGEVTHVGGDGEFVLDTTDLTLLEIGERWAQVPDDPTADGRPAHTAAEGALAAVSPDSPAAEFEAAFPDAPDSGLLAYLPGPGSWRPWEDGDVTAQGAYFCYRNWYPLPLVDMADEQYMPCTEEP